MMILISLLLCLVAFVYFSLANDKHLSTVDDEANMSTVFFYAMHIIAWLVLIVAMVLCIDVWDVEIGVTVWVGMTQLASLCVALSITYLPKFYSVFARILLLGQLRFIHA